ncbi:MAG: sugar ABC transporter substrate-binding protein [Anaerolineae bacterium]|nr:sugar ABC transporter substrate-binding protein [Anaerolineae bacterium]
MSKHHVRSVRAAGARLALVLLIAVVAAGCIQSTPTPVPVTISFAHPNYDTEYYQQLLVQFNELYPYITVELRPKGWDMLGGLGAGDADVFLTSQFALSWLSEQRSILDLTPFIEQDASFDQEDFYPGTLGLYTSEGETWAIPAGVDLMVMYYNQDLFDLYGAPYPSLGWTWDDFLAAAMSVRDPTADTFGYVSTTEVFDALAFIYQHGGSIFDNLQQPTQTTFDDTQTIEALDWYANLYTQHNVAPTMAQMRTSFGREDPRIGIQLGRVGIWSGMLSERGGQTWRAEWEMNWGVAPLPRDERTTTLTLIQGLFVSSQTKHPDACWAWISYLSRQLPQREAPVRRSLAESDAYEERVGAHVAAVVQTSMEDALLLSPRLAEFEESLELFTQAFAAIMEGRSPPEEAMSWAQQQSKLK